jgi:hypothetical protein
LLYALSPNFTKQSADSMSNPRSPKDFKHDLNIFHMDKNASIIWNLFYAGGSSECAGSNSKMISKWLIGKSMEGCGFYLYFCTMLKFDWRDWGNSRTFSVRIGCLLLAESNTLDLPKTIQDSLTQIKAPTGLAAQEDPVVKLCLHTHAMLIFVLDSVDWAPLLR